MSHTTSIKRKHDAYIRAVGRNRMSFYRQSNVSEFCQFLLTLGGRRSLSRTALTASAPQWPCESKEARMDFIFMLTRNDKTVSDCLHVIDLIEPLGLRHIGLKDVGVTEASAGELVNRIKARGATSYMEVVSTTPQAAGRSIRTACASLEIRRPDGCSVPGGASDDGCDEHEIWQHGGPRYRDPVRAAGGR